MIFRQVSQSSLVRLLDGSEVFVWPFKIIDTYLLDMSIACKSGLFRLNVVLCEYSVYVTGERVESRQVTVNKYMPTVTMTSLSQGKQAGQPPPQPEYREVALRYVLNTPNKYI